MARMKILDKGYVKLLSVAGPFGPAANEDPADTARMSFDNAYEDRTHEQDMRLVKYLHTHKHTTPFEFIETYWEMKLPIFVARQLVRHRTASINEVSRRYVTDNIEFHIPETWRKASANKKQGSLDENVDRQTHLNMDEYYCNSISTAIDVYHDMLEQGVCPEQARMILPVSLYTRWAFKIDLHNCLHLIELRTNEHAQYETRQYANAMQVLLKGALPDLMDIISKKE